MIGNKPERSRIYRHERSEKWMLDSNLTDVLCCYSCQLYDVETWLRNHLRLMYIV